MSDFRIPESEMVPVDPTSAMTAGKRAHYVQIPIPWVKAANLAGKRALAVGCVLWYRHKAHQEDDIILSNILAANFGLSRKAKASGLRELREAGLVKVVDGFGRSPRVTLLPAPPHPRTEGGGESRMISVSCPPQDSK